MNKKVLIIANLYYASPRIPAAAKYLADFGWEPTIITVPIGRNPKKYLALPDNFEKNARIIETPYNGDVFVFWRKVLAFFGFRSDKSMLNQAKEKMGASSQKSLIDYLMKAYQTIFAYPDEERKWKNPAIAAIEEILRKEKFNAILSSSSPATAHIVAENISRKHNISWVADFRDLWTQNHDYKYNKLRKFFETRLEKKTLKSAKGLITVSRPMAEKLESLHNGRKAEVITNGFDPEKVNRGETELTKGFTITYTGQIYNGKQDPIKFLTALRELVDERKINAENIDVRFFGADNFWFKNEIEKMGLEGIVKQYGRIDREVALKKQRESQLLLLFNWEDESQKGVYTGKVFEYLAAKRPIIATGGNRNDVVEELLNQTSAGVNAREVDEIKSAFLRFYEEYKRDGKIPYMGNEAEINKYNYKRLAEKLSRVLDGQSK